MPSRDEKLAAKLRAKQGDSYESASARNARLGQGTPPKPPVTGRTSQVEQIDPTRHGGLTDAEARAAYDAVHNTPASARRRSEARSDKGIGRWRNSVKPEYR